MEPILPNEDTRSTEEKIIAAAQKVFTQKGYAATRTRDIAEEAGINLALLNYYFRSKEKLFAQIMLANMKQLFGTVIQIMNAPDTDVDTKTELLVSGYIELLTKNPDLPMFVLSELRHNPDHLTDNIMVGNPIMNSVFVKQIKEAQPALHPFQILMSILGLTVFPYLARPMLQKIGNVDDEAYFEIMQARKPIIIKMIKNLLHNS